MTWKSVTDTDVKTLTQVRQQLHEAVQIISSAGISFCPHQPDDSHTNMKWLNNIQSLAGNEFGEQDSFRLALNLPEMKLLLLKGKDEILARFSLHGKTVHQAIDWFRQELENRNFDTSRFTTKRHYTIPPSDQASGKAFDLFDQAAFSTFTDHFANAHFVLKKTAYQYSGSSPVRCWPHHFDMGMIITLQAGDDPEERKSIGMGFSPGDENYEQPYYYVYPWPYPEVSLLKNSDLPADAYWHTTGFVSAVLKADNFIKHTDQQVCVQQFLTKALQVSRKLLSV